MRGRVLVIAGSDSGAGAGIQADIKTIAALGGYATTAITALTAQNTLGVQALQAVPADFVIKQIESVLGDIGADAIKLGMLANEGIAAAVTARLAKETIPIVLDPVMISTSGAALLDLAAVEILRKRLIPMSALVTPNIPEAEALADMRIATMDDRRAAARKFLALGAKAVLLKGGHGEGATVTDLYMTYTSKRPSPSWEREGPVPQEREGEGVGNSIIHPHPARKLADLSREGEVIIEFSTPRLATKHTHGTGCTLASAIAVGLAQGMDMIAAIERAHAYVQNAIRTAPGLGQGKGPLNHMVSL